MTTLRRRKMYSKSERLTLALEKLKEVKKETKCSEDFIENQKYPTFSLENIKELSQRDDFLKILQLFMLQKSSKDFLEWLIIKTQDLFDPLQYLSAQVASILKIGYGECLVLSNFLIYKLMQTNEFSVISRYEIGANEAVSHAFVVIEDEHGIKWALDPFFNLCCPLTDYWVNEKLVSFFNKNLHVPNWNMNCSRIRESEYLADIQTTALQIYEEQIPVLCKIIDSEECPIMETIIRAKNLTEDDYEFGLLYLKEYFIKDAASTFNVHPISATIYVNKAFENISPNNFSNRNKVKGVIQNVTNSNSDFFKDPHEQVTIKLEKILPKKDATSSFWKIIDSRDYSRALRMVSTMKNQKISIRSAKILCEFKEPLSIDINQKNSQGFSAIDYAREKGNELLAEYLESQAEKVNTLLNEDCPI